MTDGQKLLIITHKYSLIFKEHQRLVTNNMDQSNLIPKSIGISTDLLRAVAGHIFLKMNSPQTVVIRTIGSSRCRIRTYRRSLVYYVLHKYRQIL
jgi:hypothetical protein